jgi:hypothetical protein
MIKTIILTVEIKIDENQIAHKYPNFGFNYNLRADSKPTGNAMIAFAKKQVMTENQMRDFGFSAKITKASFK